MNNRHALNQRECLAVLAGAAWAPFRLNSHAASQPAASAPRRWVAVQRTLDEFVAGGTAAGAAVGLSYGGASPVYPAAGTIAFDSPLRFDENSICRIYSMTKNVTRIAAILLVEDGKIRLDQPVADVLPELRSLQVAIDIEKGLESRPAVNTMTMRHLLTNTSGLGNWTPASDGGDALHAVYRQRRSAFRNRGFS
jgi:CubicO group peptidase (beta-lactamase class C family)